MSYTKANYRDVDPVGDGMYFLRDELDAETIGLTVLDCEAGWEGKEHDHEEQNHEEIYYLVEGRATVAVDGDDVDLTPGDALRISPDADRLIKNGNQPSTFVLVGAP